MKAKSKTKAKSHKEKPSAARDPVTGELIATRLAKLINTSVYVDWTDPKHDWHYFTVLEVNKAKTKVKLNGVYPETGDYGDSVWVAINDIKDVWRAPNALEGMRFKQTVMRLVEESIRSIDQYIPVTGNERERMYSDGLESGLSQAKEELESLLNKIKVS